MEPSSALDGVRFRGEVDWVKVRVTLSSPSQFRHVRARLKKRFGNTYVIPCDGEASSLRFIFPVQNPAGPSQLMRDLQGLARPGGPPITDADVEIVGIEVALDGYITGSDRERLAAITGHLVKHLAHRPAGPPRATSPRRFQVPSTARDLRQLIEQEASINMGAIEDDFRVRAYLKDYDTIADRRSTLPSAKQRARIEVTLAGDNLPFRTIEEWRNFRFESLSETRFAMCRPHTSTDMAAALSERALQLGRSADSYKIRPSDRRKRPAFTRRDVPTNDSIRKALKSLTLRQTCRNSEKISAQTTASSEGNSNSRPRLLNTATGNSGHTPQQSVMTISKRTHVNEEVASNLNKVEVVANNDEEFGTDLPEGWGSW